jgi:hypothetical protein
MKELEAIGVDLAANDVLHNLVTKNSQLMMDEIPWRGSREKDPLFFQMLIEPTTSVENIVFNCTASTSNESISLFPFILFRQLYIKCIQ